MESVMKKEQWETLVLEVIAIDGEDVITTSPTTSNITSGKEPGEGEID